MFPFYELFMRSTNAFTALVKKNAIANPFLFICQVCFN